jgi:hypothetical protein
MSAVQTKSDACVFVDGEDGMSDGLDFFFQCQEADQNEQAPLRYEIERRVRNQLVEESVPGTYRMAMLSCMTGRWDDLIRDVQRGRVTFDQAFEIVQKIKDARLITVSIYDAMRERITEQQK